MSISLAGWRSKGRLGKIVLLVICFSFILASAASADLFLKFDGIEGGSTAEDHPKWIGLESCQWGVSTAKKTGSGAGKPKFDDFSWTQEMDKSFPALFADTASGKHIKDATVDFTAHISDKNVTYFQMYFKDVLLTSLQLKGTSSTIPNIFGSFAYNYIKMTYTEFDEKGRKAGSQWADFDLKKNRGSVGNLALLFAQGVSGPTVVSSVPVPASLFLLGSGLVGLIGLRRKFKL
jgi:type VI secretion system secreted protein Hcp